MLDDLFRHDRIATIKLAQTTFSHIQLEGELFKLTYQHKAEAYIKPGTQGLLSLHQHHPMLLSYNEPKVTIYVGSKVEAPREVAQEIEEAASLVFQGWRDWRINLFGNNKPAAELLFQDNLRTGYGTLMGGAPVSVARAVLAVCDRYGVRTTVFGDINAEPVEPPIYKILTIGPCYVIAKNFECSHV